MKNLFELLGLTPSENLSDSQLTEAYQKACAQFQEIHAAYEKLLNPHFRLQYAQQIINPPNDTPEPFLQDIRCFSVNIPAKDRYFTGREQDLLKLKQFFKIQSPSTNQIVVLHGPAGVGKTALAVEFIYHNFFRTVFWISASTSEQLEKGFRDVAEALSIDATHFDLPTLKTQILKCLAQLNEEYLFVFDNVKNPEQIYDFASRFHNKVFAVVTTRYAHFNHHSQLKIDVFTPDEARAYVVKYLSNDTTRRDLQDSIDTLNKEFSFLPLAISKALEHISHISSTIPAFLKLYQRYGMKKLYQINRVNILCDIWDPTLAIIEGKVPKATRLLELVTYCGCNDIPLSLIRKLWKSLQTDNQQLCEDAQSKLANYSLWGINVSKDSLSLSPFVKEVMQANLTTSQNIEDLKLIISVLKTHQRPLNDDLRDCAVSACKIATKNLDPAVLNNCLWFSELNQMINSSDNQSHPLLNTFFATRVQSALDIDDDNDTVKKLDPNAT